LKEILIILILATALTLMIVWPTGGEQHSSDLDKSKVGAIVFQLVAVIGSVVAGMRFGRQTRTRRKRRQSVEIKPLTGIPKDEP